MHPARYEQNQARFNMQDTFRSKPVLQPTDASSLQETFFAQVARWVDWERREEPRERSSRGISQIDRPFDTVSMFGLHESSHPCINY